ncbi:ABC transporter ATP-binding protein [Candidatus Omnitrophota bacterium]
MSDILIQAEHISKKYCRYLKDSMVYGLSDVGRNAFGLSSHSDQLRKNEFWSVDDVSFEVKRGETLGLVGANGSGKTTILKMLNGIFWPDKGKITIRGQVGALIAVGAGFHPLLTGRENVYVNGAILGMSKQEVDRKFDSIVDFADIGDFIDSPIKHYSSGMYVRLGFAVAVHSHCNILLIDEILAVGDINFQAKCIDKIKERAAQGVAIVFISHNFDAVQMLCKNTIYLSKGKIIQYGNTDKILTALRKDVADGLTINVDGVRRGTMDVEIKKVELLDSSDSVKERFRRGESLNVKITYFAKTPVQNVNFSFEVSAENGPIVYDARSGEEGFQSGQIQGEGTIIYKVESKELSAGKYRLSIGCWDSAEYICYDFHEKLYPLVIDEGDDIPNRWEIKKKDLNCR